MTIWIDADSLPKSLRPIVMKAAVRLGAAAFFVADRPLKDVQSFIADDTYRIRCEHDGDKSFKSDIHMVVVQSGANSADDYIVENASENCLCITHDIPLASRLLEKNCIVIDDRGGIYDRDNINALLKNREVNNTLREYGVFSQQMSKTTTNASIKAFSDNFDRVLTKHFR